MNELLRLRNAVYACFLLVGVIMASWIVRTPSIRDALGASTFDMGLVLFGLSVGSMAGILRAASAVRAFGTRRVITAGIVLSIIGILLIALGAQISATWVVAIGLMSIGVAMAACEVSGNVEGAVLERGLSRSILPILHGCYSLGTVIGALLGMYMAALQVPAALHLSGLGIILIPVAGWTIYALFNSPTSFEDEQHHGGGFFATMSGDRQLLLLSVIVLGMALAEGAANDWLPLLMVDAHGMPEGYASMMFVVFASTMTIGRFMGPALLRLFGPVSVLRFSIAAAIAGVSTVVLADNSAVAAVAILLWGIGSSLGFPVVMSIAGGDGKNASARVGAVATIGYLAFLVGPPLLGFVGEHFGLRLTMIIVVVMLIPCIVFAFSLRAQK